MQKIIAERQGAAVDSATLVLLLCDLLELVIVGGLFLPTTGIFLLHFLVFLLKKSMYNLFNFFTHGLSFDEDAEVVIKEADAVGAFLHFSTEAIYLESFCADFENIS